MTIPHLDILSSPDFAIRRIGIGSWVKATPDERKLYEMDWCDKLAFNGGQFESYPGVGDGYLGRLLPFTEYCESHPEYYAMNKKGVREKPERERHTMLCLSNPEVLSESIRRIEEIFVSGTHENYAHIFHNGIGISPPDGSPYCYCPQCEQESQNLEYPKYVYGPQMSEEFFNFASKIAEAFPDKWIATMAYALREMSPQGVSLLPNMTVFYAPISCCALHDVSVASCWRRQEFRKILTQWRRQTPIDVTTFVKAGKINTIAIRLWNKAEVGGLIRRGFFWSPAELASAEEVATSSAEPPSGHLRQGRDVASIEEPAAESVRIPTGYDKTTLRSTLRSVANVATSNLRSYSQSPKQSDPLLSTASFRFGSVDG